MSDDRTMPDGVPADVTEVSAEVLDELGRLFGDQTIDDDPSVTVTIAEDGGTGASETVQIIDAGDPSAPPLVVPVDRTVDDSPAGGEVLAFSRPVPAPAPADPLLVIDEDTVATDSSASGGGSSRASSQSWSSWCSHCSHRLSSPSVACRWREPSTHPTSRSQTCDGS